MEAVRGVALEKDGLSGSEKSEPSTPHDFQDRGLVEPGE
jgi:hypothetical protein